MKKINLLFVAGLFISVINLNAQDWQETNKIVASDRNSGDLFGSCVDIDGHNAIVGAYGNSYDTENDNYLYKSGSVYILSKIDGS